MKEATSKETIVVFSKKLKRKSVIKKELSSEYKAEQPKPLKKSFSETTVSKSEKWPIIHSTNDNGLVDKNKRNKSKATGQLKTINLLLNRNLG